MWGRFTGRQMGSDMDLGFVRKAQRLVQSAEVMSKWGFSSASWNRWETLAALVSGWSLGLGLMHCLREPCQNFPRQRWRGIISPAVVIMWGSSLGKWSVCGSSLYALISSLTHKKALLFLEVSHFLYSFHPSLLRLHLARLLLRTHGRDCMHHTYATGLVNLSNAEAHKF